MPADILAVTVFERSWESANVAEVKQLVTSLSIRTKLQSGKCLSSLSGFEKISLQWWLTLDICKMQFHCIVFR